MKKLINLITLGCSKNLVDSEHLGAQLAATGYKIVFDSNEAAAKIIVINTCGFIGDAKEESVNTILQYANAKQVGLIDQLFVFGCLSERYANDLRTEIPEVDEFFGAKNLKDIINKLGGRYKTELIGEREVSTPEHFAYLKISEGCNWQCSYCAIPLIRGKFESVPMEELLIEANKLAAKGVKELIVIAQDSTYYGLDIYKKHSLGTLLHKLSEIKGIEWIRLHYAYPSKFPQDVIDEMASNPKICHYLDIPFQHISNTVLKNMRRGASTEIYKLIDDLRAKIPDIALRTTLLVGHPGEDEQAFEELKKFVQKVKFDRLGVFQYSEEEGTFGAKNFDDNIPESVKQNRADEIMQIQNSISQELNRAKIGKQFCVIVDRIEDEFVVARSQYDSPEVDQEVLIDIKTCITIPRIGDFIDVKIVAGDDYDLIAEII